MYIIFLFHQEESADSNISDSPGKQCLTKTTWTLARGQLYKTLNYDLTSHRVVNT